MKKIRKSPDNKFNIRLDESDQAKIIEMTGESMSWPESIKLIILYAWKYHQAVGKWFEQNLDKIE